MITIYGSDLSSPAIKVRLAANAMGIDYEYKRIDMRAGEHRKPEFLKLHPAGKVPVMTDGDFVLFESNAIMRYLARKCKSPLYPSELPDRATVEQWIDFASIHINGAMGRVVYNRLFAPIRGVPVDEQSLKDGLGFLERFLPVVDAQLGKSKFLAGEQMTLADICLLATLDPAEAAKVDLSPYANLTKWRNDLKKQEFYTKCHEGYLETLQQMMAKK